MRRSRRVLAFLSVLALSAPAAFATDIEGVQPASLDQPRIHLHLRRTPDGKPLAAGGGGGGDAKGKKNPLGEALGIDLGVESAINVQAFLDTGASGIMLSKVTADALGVKRETVKTAGKDTPEPVEFIDVGVGGDEHFTVSEPLHLFLAHWDRSGEPDDADGYRVRSGPVRVHIPKASGLMDMMTGGLDVVGMPVMKGRVVVIDPKPVDTFADVMRTSVYDAAEARKLPKGPNGIPPTDRHVRLTYVSFADFTRTEPPQGPGPTLAPNPFIGPGPQVGERPVKSEVKAPPVVAGYKGKTQAGSWLLDTGAAASILSEKQAAQLGVTYVADTKGTAKPKLAGVPEKDQFTLPIGGVGGSTTVAGFYLDTLTIPTAEGDPLVYKRAPVLVKDITVQHHQTGREVTLDGVFGMNYLVASANVSAGLLPDLGNLTVGPYDWIVFDEPAGVLGLKLKNLP